jgi:hypothetical protein
MKNEAPYNGEGKQKKKMYIKSLLASMPKTQ